MKTNTDTLLTFFTGGAFSAIVYLVGGIDKLMIAFTIFMICDYFTGILSGFSEKNVSSKRAFNGIAKKAGMITFVIVANQFDIISGNTQGFLRNAMLMFLIGTEGISILENLGRLGLQVPEFITSTFERLKGISHDEKEKEKKSEKI